MLHINSHFFKRRPHREYLYDDYNRPKSALTVWFQRLIMAIIFIILGMFLMMLSNMAHASNDTSHLDRVNLNNVSEGSLLIKTETPNQFQQLPLLQTDVAIKISGMIARSHIKQRFENTSNTWIEATYVFPLPETAAVDHMRMHIGTRIIEGQIKEKAQAKRIYEQAKREGKKTALIEQQRPNLFTNSVANIAPGESITVEIEYQQVLQYEQGDFSLRFPMAITPRYIPGEAIEETISTNSASTGSAYTGSGWALNTLQVPDASQITPPVHSGINRVNPVSINIKLDAGFPLKKINSRYHAIVQKALPNNLINIRLSENTVASDRDFELVWTPEAGYSPRAAVFSETINDSHYQLLMVLPPDNGGYNEQPLAREVIYIIDTSGSMHGISIEQAKRSLVMSLERLRIHDRFNIIEFNSVTGQLFSTSHIANFENIQKAKQYVDNLQADGGTEMAPALKLALRQPQISNHVRQVIFLTDGSVGNETELFDIIHNDLANSRLFTIGIGSAPNSYFMRKAAKFGRGSFTYISNVNEVNEKMSALFSKLENPLMTDLNILFADGVTAEVWPQRIPDLYHGEPIILSLKTEKPLTHVTIRGTRALAPWTAKLKLQQGKSASGLGTFWARSKIGSLMDSLHEGADKQQVRENIIDIALEHHLVSKHTSLVAVDVTPSRPLEHHLDKQALAVNLPYGQSHQKIFGRLPQTATSAELQLISGFSLLLLSLLSQLIRWPVLKDNAG